MVTFAVDAVEPASDRLPTHTLRQQFPYALALGADPAMSVLKNLAVDPLFEAVSLAFREHRPLVLSPDVVWLTIARGIAQHISLNPEALRERLVRHSGKETIVLEAAALPNESHAWTRVIGQLRGLLAHRIGDGRARFFECDFSTSTEVERVASHVVLLSAYAAYFDYEIDYACGIPKVTLTGTPEDWRRIRERLELLAELDLAFWQRSLAPMLDHFVRAASGDVDVRFWQRIYNPIDAYGGEVVTGWITRFYPYIKSGAAADQKNPMLELAIDEPRNVSSKGPDYSGPGVWADDIPTTQASVPVKVTERGSNVALHLMLEAGVVAIAQDADGSLRPIAGWHLLRANPKIDDVVAQLTRTEPSLEPPDPPGSTQSMHHTSELRVLMAAVDTKPFFTDGTAWTVRPEKTHDYVHVVGAERWAIHRVIDFPDGSSLCHARPGDQAYSGDVHWVVCRLPESEIGRVVFPSFAVPCRTIRALDSAANTPLLGSSLAALLEIAIETRGDLSSVRYGTLAELVGA